MHRDNDIKDKQWRILRGWRLSSILLIVSIAIFGLMMTAVKDFNFAQLSTLFSHLEAPIIFVLLTLSIINFSLRSIRWIWFSHNLKLDIPWKKSTIYYLAGFSMGVTPGRMGEIIRLWLLRREHGVSYHRALPLLIGDRVNDLMVITVLALSAGAMIESSSVFIALVALTFVISTNILLRHPSLLIKAIDMLYSLLQRWQKLFAATRRSLKTGRDVFSGINASIASVCSILAWFAECYAFYFLLSTLELNISLEVATFIYAFATLVGALSFLPGGLGGFEATAIILLNTHGIDVGTAAFTVSIIRLTTLWFSVAIGSYFLSLVFLSKGITTKAEMNDG